MKNKVIHNRLISLQKAVQEDPSSFSSGICSAMYEFLLGLDEGSEWEGWIVGVNHMFGLHMYYPVPSPIHKDNHVGYDYFQHRDQMWTGEYGENRKYYLSLLIRLVSGEVLSPYDVQWPFPYKG